MLDHYAQNMSRRASEAKRLDEQFDLLTENIGYLLHPSVAETLPAQPRVADIGTGTGIYLFRIRELYPEATLHGYDISSKLYPEASTVPTNMLFKVLDVKANIPDDLKERYNLIHIRLLAAAMLPDDWRRTVSNVAQLLKPGGILQWEECNWSGVKHMRGAVDSSVSAAQLMGKVFRDGLKLYFQHGWDTLHDDMVAAGLVSVTSDMVSSDRVPSTRERMTANGMQAIFTWARMVSTQNQSGSLTAEQLSDLEIEVQKDISSGCYVRFDIHIVYGTK
ncbi:S-adenosyl-L-methionine-dependent methyltransferase [Xylariaceae sp. FL0255]|nr:S-adenosyl-L-methionine-dependent methyltransferase [Xylariaceae sp. FL0255]